jgi:hypothetical protein
MRGELKRENRTRGREENSIKWKRTEQRREEKRRSGNSISLLLYRR